jgi:hypothetical protein
MKKKKKKKMMKMVVGTIPAHASGFPGLKFQIRLDIFRSNYNVCMGRIGSIAY